MKIGKRIIQKALRECAFDPNVPGPISVIFDIGGPNYWENRAIELIKDSKSGFHYDENLYNQRITMAIQLLTYAKLYREKELSNHEHRREAK